MRVAGVRHMYSLWADPPSMQCISGSELSDDQRASHCKNVGDMGAFLAVMLPGSRCVW